MVIDEYAEVSFMIHVVASPENSLKTWYLTWTIAVLQDIELHALGSSVTVHPYSFMVFSTMEAEILRHNLVNLNVKHSSTI